MTLIEEIKLKLRLKTDAFDSGDISPLVSACKVDLKRAGVKTVDDTEPLTRQAIKLYCQAYFGKDSEAERYRKCYESLRDSLALMGDDLFA